MKALLVAKGLGEAAAAMQAEEIMQSTEKAATAAAEKAAKEQAAAAARDALQESAAADTAHWAAFRAQKAKEQEGANKARYEQRQKQLAPPRPAATVKAAAEPPQLAAAGDTGKAAHLSPGCSHSPREEAHTAEELMLQELEEDMASRLRWRLRG